MNTTGFRIYWLIVPTCFFSIVILGKYLFDQQRINSDPVRTENFQSISMADQLSGQPLRFVVNNGQASTDALYHVQGAGHMVLFFRDQIVFQRTQSEAGRNKIVLRFEGANHAPVVAGKQKLRGVAHFYLGADPADWHTNVPTYGAVLYRDLYPGIDMAYIGDRGSLETEYYLAVGADYTRIRLNYEGVASISIRDDGALVLDTPLGELIENVPVAYQKIDAHNVNIDVVHVLFEDNTVGFKLGSYDPDYPIVIDPRLVFIATISAAGGDVQITGVAIDNDGNILAAGSAGLYFPTTDLIVGSNHAGGSSVDGLLLKLDGTTGEVLYSALFGGVDLDLFTGIAVDAVGTVYLTGLTSSTDFPVMNAAQAASGGSDDAFLVILNAAGELTYSSYLGGTLKDWGQGVALDGTGNIFVAGKTESTDFPVSGGFQQQHNGGSAGSLFQSDIFIAKYNSIGSVEYASYLGGSGNDEFCGIAATGAGLATIAGYTNSTDFPVANAYQATFVPGGADFRGGGSDMVITRPNSAGDGLVYSTYFGGTDNDFCSGIALGPDGDAFVSGHSKSQDFTIIGGPSVPEPGVNDGILLMLDNSGQPVYSVRSNTPDADVFSRVAVDANHTAFVVRTYLDSIQLIEKPLEGPLEMTLSFAAPDHFVNSVYLLNAKLAIGGTHFVNNLPNGPHDNENPYLSIGFRSGSEGFVAPLILKTGPILFASKIPPPGVIEPPTVGQSITWTISVINVGDEKAEDVKLEDFPGTKLEILEGSLFTYLFLEPGEQRTEFVTTKIISVSSGVEGRVVNKVLASASNASAVIAQSKLEVSSMRLFANVARLLFAGPGKQFDRLAGSVDVYLDSVLVANDLAKQSRSETSQVELRYSSPVLEIVDAGSPNNSNPLASFTLDLTVPDSETITRMSEHTFFLLNQVTEDSISALVKLDARQEALDPQTTEFFFANFTNAPFDVVLLSNRIGKTAEEDIIDDLAPGSTSEYFAVNPGVHFLELRSEDHITLLDVFEFDWTDSSGDAVAIVVGGDTASIQAITIAGDGAFSDPRVVTSIEDGSEQPISFRLLGNYPNPFNPSTTLLYEIGVQTNVTVTIYDALGRRVRTLLKNEIVAGKHELVWDGRNEGGSLVASGTYIVQLETDYGSDSKSLTLFK